MLWLYALLIIATIGHKKLYWLPFTNSLSVSLQNVVAFAGILEFRELRGYPWLWQISSTSWGKVFQGYDPSWPKMYTIPYSRLWQISSTSWGKVFQGYNPSWPKMHTYIDRTINVIIIVMTKWPTFLIMTVVYNKILFYFYYYFLIILLL